MALDWQFGKIKNFKKVCYIKGRMNLVSHSLIYATMAIGLNEITSKNWTKFYARLHLWELVHGSNLSRNAKRILITADEVKMHIGLSTNASVFSDAKFLSNFSRKLREIEGSIATENRKDKAESGKDAAV